MKIPSTILAPSSQSHIKLIDQLSDPSPSLIDRLSPAELHAPLPELARSSSPPVLPTGRCFICIHIHGLPNCVSTLPSVRRRTTAIWLLKNKHPLTSGHLLRTTPQAPAPLCTLKHTYSVMVSFGLKTNWEETSFVFCGRHS